MKPAGQRLRTAYALGSSSDFWNAGHGRQLMAPVSNLTARSGRSREGDSDDASDDARDAASDDGSADAPDAGTSDFDAPVGAPDAASAMVACGADLMCNTWTEVCLIMHQGGPLAPIYSCEPIPASCAPERNCNCVVLAICEAAPSMNEADYCHGDPLETIECGCLSCF